MDILVSCLAVLFASSMIVDWLVRNEKGLNFHVQSPVDRIGALEPDDILHAATIWFSDIFDTIYGERTWSWRRVYRSALLSLFFVLFSVLIIGIENTYIGTTREHQEIIYISMIFFSINLFIDFVSLLETRWIIEQMRKRRTATFFAMWVILDIVLTSGIYFFLLGTIVVVTAAVQIGRIDKIISILISADFASSFARTLFAPHMALPFFVSTFGTSILWYMFVLFSIVIRIGSRSSRIFEISLRVIFESESPGRLIAFIVGATLTTFFLGVKAGSWVLSVL